MESVVDQVTATVLDADDLPPRYLNEKLRELMARGETVVVQNPRSRHNLGVALPGPGHVTFKGSVGYYCGGLSNGGLVDIVGNAGWGIGESMARGLIRVRGSVGQSVGASLRGGTIVVEGDAGPRAGVAQKGGVVVVGGSIGFLSGFMAQRGKLIALGDDIESIIAEVGFPLKVREWKKIVSGRKLWYFDKREGQTWLKI